MCKAGYKLAEIYDSLGNLNVVCVADFCGFYGSGIRCSNEVTIEGCDLSTSVDVGRDSYESCERCTSGYTKVPDATNGDNGVNACSPIRG